MNKHKNNQEVFRNIWTLFKKYSIYITLYFDFFASWRPNTVGVTSPPPKNCLTRSPYIYILVCFASQVSQQKSFGVSYITYSWHLMMLYLPYYHPEAIGPPWHIFNVSTSNGRAYIVSRHDQDSASEALKHMMLL